MIIKILTFIIFLIINIISFNFLIKFLHQKQMGQSIRKVGPKKHLKKSGTPTMGGILIIINTCLFLLIFIKIFKINIDIKKLIMLLLPFIGYGLIGFIDDYLIIKNHNNQGLKPTLKFILELLLAGIYYFLYLELGFKNELNLFGIYINLEFLYGVFIILFFTGITNATNFTDGIDGLLGSNAIISFGGIAIISYLKKEEICFWLCVIVIFGILSFLLYNLPKASIFMGDTGSLAIGGLISSMLIILKCEILILFFGFIYLVEIISVILQVWYFKRTKGKRLFKMTPLHHHFELLNLSENKIDSLFSFINLIMTIIGIYLGVIVF